MKKLLHVGQLLMINKIVLFLVQKLGPYFLLLRELLQTFKEAIGDISQLSKQKLRQFFTKIISLTIIGFRVVLLKRISSRNSYKEARTLCPIICSLIDSSIAVACSRKKVDLSTIVKTCQPLPTIVIFKKYEIDFLLFDTS